MPPAILQGTRTALADVEAWLVGGAVRDRLLGRATDDLDVIVRGDVAESARRVARALPGAAFALSERHGAWRVVARDGRGHVDLTAVRDGSLEADLRARDFTVNALAEPLGGGGLIDPTGGGTDLRARRLRLVSEEALRADPLRTLRLARLACELDFEADGDSLAAARRHADGLAKVAGERVFGELQRILRAPRVSRGLDLMDEAGATAVVLPELWATRGIEQNRFHHLDVHDHTRAVLEAVLSLEDDPAAVLGDEHAPELRALLDEPLADEMTRGVALRLGALLHDAAKPLTRDRRPDGRVTFIGHDAAGARLVRAVLDRLRASERLSSHVAALAEHHLRLGFLVHRRPLSRRDLYRYLDACQPVAVDVTLLSVADRLATRGDNAQAAIAVHLELAREVVGPALSWHRAGRPHPPVRGDALARALDIAPGPELGRLLDRLREAAWTGEAEGEAQAVELARAWLGQSGG